MDEILILRSATLAAPVARRTPARRFSRILALGYLLSGGILWAGSGGSISGTVRDPSGAVVANAKVTVTEISTHVSETQSTDVEGFYSFLSLPVGNYNVHAEASGFGPYLRTNVVLDTDGKAIVNVTLTIGSTAEQVTISDSATRIDTADTQMGEVITGNETTTIPLNGRSYTDLIGLQPGAAPQTSVRPTDFEASSVSPSGNLDPGNLSINGQRAQDNGFVVNGADVVERVLMGAAIIPNLDSISEFRVLTGNFDAKYGGFNGGLITVITKSGSDRVHGSAFEFLRNTKLDARSYFSPTINENLPDQDSNRGVFQQNQFGGTLGAPIVRTKIFFFTDYQGTRLRQGIPTGIINVPSLEDRTGNLSDLSGELTGTVHGQYWASQLSSRLGYAVVPGENYYLPGCATSTQCVFPNAVVPESAWSAPAQNLLQYIPQPNYGDDSFSSSAQELKLRDDKGSFRLDANTRWGMLSAYYFIDDYLLNNPYPTGQGGATVPGFSANNLGRAQLVRLLDTKTLGATAVNEFQFSYMRNANQLGNPVGGVGITLASQGFVTGPGTPGIVALAPEIEGVANIVFNSFTMGETTAGLTQTANTFEWLENFSKQIHTHSLALGIEVMFDQVNGNPNVQKNGSFGITGTETGVDFADFLLGIASDYTQGESRSFYNRNRYLGLFIQDSWRITRRLTLNYGLRYDPLMPWYEKNNQIQTLVLGEQSVVFPGAPAGLVVPGDPDIPRTLAPTRWNNFSPRIGLAYSPPAFRGPIGSILGGDGRSSIHAGFGRFFASIEGISAGVMSANAPFGITYTSPAPPLMVTPFISAADGSNQGQRFPLALPPLDASAKNPDPNVNWSLYEPITGVPGYLPTNRSPYTEQYNLSLQRQIRTSSVLKIAYVGSQAHHLLLLVEANPGNAALCLSVSQPSQVMPGTATCGPFGESATYITANGAVIKGTRSPYGSNFGSDTYQAAAGNSNFNSLQVTFRQRWRGLDLLAGYTYGKSLDFASSLGDQVNPYNYRLLYSPSSFDLKQNFLFSYVCNVPVAYIFESKNRLTEGWMFSGITRFTTGFPVTLDNSSDHSLLGTQPNGVNNYGVDEPNVEPGPLELNHNPRNGQPYFNTTLFSLPPLGQYGNAKRRMFYGPGSANFDMAVLKRVTLKESSQLEFRFDFFNVFNHAQFFGPETVDDEILSPEFGQVTSSAPPRLVQVAMKIMF